MIVVTELEIIKYRKTVVHSQQLLKTYLYSGFHVCSVQKPSILLGVYVKEGQGCIATKHYD